MHYARKSVVASLLVTLMLVGCPAELQRPDEAARRPDLAQLTARLSEPGGYFGSDNLVSNELSYQHVLAKLAHMNVAGGAYIGVGPDQNFTYIAQIKPRVAFMLDIRRDSLLQHLVFKAMFVMARNRIEYLCLLFGFQGRYRVRGGEVELGRITEQLQHDLMRHRIIEEETLSPRGARPQETAGRARRNLPIVWLSAMAVVVAVVINLTLHFTLDSSVSVVKDRIAALKAR